MRAGSFARLSNDIKCGFVAVENCSLIVSMKVKLIVLGLSAQSLQEFEYYGRQQPQELSSKVLQMQIFEGFEKPLSFKSVMRAYRLTAQQLRQLENYIVTQLSKKGVKWNKVEGNYALTTEDLED
jgi:hypothetical protein